MRQRPPADRPWRASTRLHNLRPRAQRTHRGHDHEQRKTRKATHASLLRGLQRLAPHPVRLRLDDHHVPIPRRRRQPRPICAERAMPDRVVVGPERRQMQPRRPIENVRTLTHSRDPRPVRHHRQPIDRRVRDRRLPHLLARRHRPLHDPPIRPARDDRPAVRREHDRAHRAAQSLARAHHFPIRHPPYAHHSARPGRRDQRSVRREHHAVQPRRRRNQFAHRRSRRYVNHMHIGIPLPDTRHQRPIRTDRGVIHRPRRIQRLDRLTCARVPQLHRLVIRARRHDRPVTRHGQRVRRLVTRVRRHIMHQCASPRIPRPDRPVVRARPDRGSIRCEQRGVAPARILEPQPTLPRRPHRTRIPPLHHHVRARAHKHPVDLERQRTKTTRVPPQRRSKPKRLGVPHLHKVVLAPRHERCPIPAPRARRHPRLVHHRPDHRARLRVVHTRRPILRAAHDPRPIRRPRHAVHRRVDLRLRHPHCQVIRAALRRVKDVHLSIPRSRGNLPPIWRPPHHADRLHTRIHAERILTRSRIPHPHRSDHAAPALRRRLHPIRRARDPRTIRTEVQPRHRRRVPLVHQSLRACHAVIHPHRRVRARGSHQRPIR